jgi:hypothetical protein
MESVADWEDRVNTVARAALMFPITYNGKAIRAFIDHGDQSQGWGGVQAQSQDIMIEVLKSDVPVVTTGPTGDTIYLPKLGETLNARGKSNSECGKFWMITLQRKR